MSSLPKGWVEIKLGELIELKYGKALPAKVRDGIGFPVYGSNGVVGSHSEPLVYGGGLIIGRKGSFGEVHISNDNFSPIDTTYYVDTFPSGTKEYWYYQLKNLPLTKLNRSTAIPGLNRDDAYAQKISLPPDNEQKRIVEKLDEVLAQVDTIKARLDGIPSLLKRFRQSVLASAVSGKLTEEWRGGSSANWDAAKLKDFVQSIEAGKNLKCIETPPVDDEHGIIKISAVTWGVYDEGQSKTLPDNRLFIENRRINVGDFLISRANTIELLGNPVIVHQVTKNLMLSDKVLRLVMEECDKPWVSIFLRSKEGRKQIESRSTGNQMSMRNIGQKALLDIDLPRFSLDEQKEIVRLVDQYFAFADTIEAQVKKAQARVNNLTQSILAKAFRGELVPQDPNDEPADKLLERIAQARIEAETLAKATKKAETARKKAEKATAKG